MGRIVPSTMIPPVGSIKTSGQKGLQFLVRAQRVSDLAALIGQQLSLLFKFIISKLREKITFKHNIIQKLSCIMDHCVINLRYATQNPVN